MPYTCCGCDRVLLAHEEVLCLDCLYHLPYTDFHQDIHNESARQLWGKLDAVFVASMLYLSKSSRTEKLIHRLKFKGFSQIGVFLGNYYGNQLVSLFQNDKLDYIVPIPIHPSKLRKRGYNQALCFANGLAQTMMVPVLNHVLLRIAASPSQVTKSRAERYDNVEHVFDIADHSISLQNKHILLVDDVLTTGATISVAGNILKKAGARVSVVTLVRA